MSTLETITECIKGETGATDVMPSTTFDSLGIDSLEFIALTLACEAAVGKEIPRDKLSHLDTVSDLVEALSA